MKKFPTHKIKIVNAEISSYLSYNPNAEVEPQIFWQIILKIEPIILDKHEIILDEEPKIESDIYLDKFPLGINNWKDLINNFEFDEPQNGSFYVTCAYNPVDVISLNIKHVSNNIYDISTEIFFDFEHEMSEFKNTTAKFKFKAQYVGFKFEVPEWHTPENLTFPEGWNIPSIESAWSKNEIITFISQYLDLTLYEEPNIQQGKILTMKPKI